MFENTNQTEEMLPANLFDTGAEDALEGISETSPEYAENGGEMSDSGKPPQGMAETLRVKYNGEEKNLSMDDARVLAQKGMNYDKVLGERNHLAELIDGYAKAAGMTREQFISHLEQNLEEYADGVDMENLRKTYPGASDDILRELASRDRKIKDAEQKERADREQSERDAAAQKPWLDFYSRHKDVSYEDLSDEFFALVEEGYTPEEAYLKLKLSELEGEQAITQQNEENSNRAVGSVKGDGTRKRDQFLDGFLGT